MVFCFELRCILFDQRYVAIVRLVLVEAKLLQWNININDVRGMESIWYLDLLLFRLGWFW